MVTGDDHINTHSDTSSLRVVILAGGLGTRLAEETESRPKPMVEIGGRPILWHIMKGYAARGLNHFVIALGYKGEQIKSYFLNYGRLATNLTVETATGKVHVHHRPEDDWSVDLVETGLETNTGGRVKRLADWLPGEVFCLTYGDGVSDVDQRQLLAFHRRHGRLATITAVRPPARFGGLVIDDENMVRQFQEKPQIGEGWINGGFMVLDRAVLDRIGGDETNLERDVLEELADDGQLMAYRHHNFWQCMDTLRDVRYVESLWQHGTPPWQVWA